MRRALLLFLLLATGVAPATAAQDAVFGGGVAGAAGFSQFPLWAALVHKVRADGEDRLLVGRPRAAPAAPIPAGALPPADCDNRCAGAHWTAFLESIRRKPRLQQLKAVNRWANAKPYIEDWVNWGVPDYWETPAEFIRRGGDCEDYAIAKYFSLIRLGFAPDDARIVVVEDRNLKASHAVVAVRDAGRTWLLDIAVPEVVPLDVARQYTPIYAFNETGWWLYPPARTAASEQKNLSKPVSVAPRP